MPTRHLEPIDWSKSVQYHTDVATYESLSDLWRLATEIAAAEGASQGQRVLVADSLDLLLDPLDADALYLYLCLGKTQQEIASILGCSQPSVSHRVNLAAHRLHHEISWRRDFPDHVDLENQLCSMLSQMNAAIIHSFLKTGVGLYTASLIGSTQSTVSGVLRRCNDVWGSLSASDPEQWARPYAYWARRYKPTTVSGQPLTRGKPNRAITYRLDEGLQ